MFRYLLLLVALTTSLAFGQESALQAKEEAVRQAVVNEDARAMDALMASKFVAVWPDGSVSDRKDQLALLGSRLTVDSVKISDVNILIIGDTAIVQGTWDIQGVWNGKPMEPRTYTHTWVKEGGDWKLASRHFTIKKK